MKFIINHFFFCAIIFLAFACGTSENTDKAAQLEQLKKERDEITLKINQLEAELLASGTMDSTDQKDQNATRVQVTTVQKAPFVHYITVQGRVVSDKNIMLTAKAAGTIIDIFVDEGQFVRQGQVLAQIDPDILKRSMAELQTGLNLANTLFERQKNLWDQNIGTEVQFLQAKNNKEALERKIASLNEQLQQTKIIAPFAGVVDEVSIKEGEVAAPGVPAIRIVSPSDFKIRAEIAENHITRVEKGNNVMIELPDYDKTIQSEVTTVSRVIDPANRTFLVEVNMPDSISKRLKANMITYINIEDYKNTDALVIPINAVQFSDEGNDYVFIAENNKAVMREVEIGKTYNNDAEVLSGLKPGDQIIVTGHRNLVDDQSIAYNELDLK